MRNIIIIYIVLIIAVVGLFYFQRNNLPFFGKSTPNAQIDGKTYNLILAKTEQEQVTGLSGRASLDKNTGMLFIFATAEYQRFWMIKMRFPIDIIYIDNNKIVDIVPDAPVPTTNDPTKLPIYTSKAPANYVLEINASQASDNKFKVGDTVTFSNIQ